MILDKIVEKTKERYSDKLDKIEEQTKEKQGINIIDFGI